MALRQVPLAIGNLFAQGDWFDEDGSGSIEANEFANNALVAPQLGDILKKLGTLFYPFWELKLPLLGILIKRKVKRKRKRKRNGGSELRGALRAPLGSPACVSVFVFVLIYV